VILGGWLWGASKVASGAPSLLNPEFPPNNLQSGDIVEVALASVDLAASETSMENPKVPALSTSDAATIASMRQRVASGDTAKFQVTAPSLLAHAGSAQGQPVTIGILVDPPLSIRLPFVFLTASIKNASRNGKLIQVH
jgi:hypothetical protein